MDMLIWMNQCMLVVLHSPYHWLNNGGRYKVVPGMSYYHRLRNDSYWNSCGSNSDLSARYYHGRGLLTYNDYSRYSFFTTRLIILNHFLKN